MNIPIYADYQNRLNPTCYEVGREGNEVLMLVCHSTAGPHDFNSLGQTPAQGQALSDASAAYLANNPAQASVQWLVGAESCKAPIYYIVREKDTAYHCGGLEGAPSQWTDPTTGKHYSGIDNNRISIGIEVLGQPKDVLGPNQLAALELLVKDIARRYQILQNPNRIIAHADIDINRTDGLNWRDLARKWVTQVANPNPNNYPIGPGFMAELTARGLTAATPENYLSVQPGMLPQSELYTVEGPILKGIKKPDNSGSWLVKVINPL